MNKILCKLIVVILSVFMITTITGCTSDYGFKDNNIVMMYEFDVTNLSLQTKDDTFFIKYKKADQGYERSEKYKPKENQVFNELTVDYASDSGYVYIVIYQDGETVIPKQKIDSSTTLDISSIKSTSKFEVSIINENAVELKLTLTVN